MRCSTKTLFRISAAIQGFRDRIRMLRCRHSPSVHHTATVRELAEEPDEFQAGGTVAVALIQRLWS